MRIIIGIVLDAALVAALAIAPAPVLQGSTVKSPASVALEFVRTALRAERAGKLEKARAWYRGAAACYRYFVLPVRLAQLDYFQESGVLLPDDLPELATETGTATDEFLDGDHSTARERLETYYLERARMTLRRSQVLELRCVTVFGGLVPLEPPGARASLERILYRLADSGAFEFLLAHLHPELDELHASSNPVRDLARTIREWERDGQFVRLAVGTEYAARLVRDGSLAYLEASIDALKSSRVVASRDHYRARAAAMRRRLENGQSRAAHYYAAAATEMEEDGEIAGAIIHGGRARRLIEQSRSQLRDDSDAANPGRPRRTHPATSRLSRGPTAAPKMGSYSGAGPNPDRTGNRFRIPDHPRTPVNLRLSRTGFRAHPATPVPAHRERGSPTSRSRP